MILQSLQAKRRKSARYSNVCSSPLTCTGGHRGAGMAGVRKVMHVWNDGFGVTQGSWSPGPQAAVGASSPHPTLFGETFRECPGIRTYCTRHLPFGESNFRWCIRIRHGIHARRPHGNMSARPEQSLGGPQSCQPSAKTKSQPQANRPRLGFQFHSSWIPGGSLAELAHNVTPDTAR